MVVVSKCYMSILRYQNSGSFKTFYVHKHGTEIIEVEVWPHIVACYRRETFKVTNILLKVDNQQSDFILNKITKWRIQNCLATLRMPSRFARSKSTRDSELI